jgi:hypothetical protein
MLNIWLYIRFLIIASITLILLSSVIASQLAVAATIEHELSASAKIQYESNPSLSPFDRDSVKKYIVTPRYQMTMGDGINEWAGELSVNIERSSDTDLSEDREDPSIALSWARLLENGSLDVTFSADERSTRETELDDTGRIFVDGTRRLYSTGVTYERGLSEYLSLELSGSLNKTKYTNINLDDFTDTGLSAKFNYKYDETITTFLELGTTHKDPDGLEDESEFYSISSGAEWLPSEYITTTATIGANKISGENSVSGQGSISMNYTSEFSVFSVSISRSLSPTGSEGFSESNQVHMNYDRTLSEYSSAGMSVNWRDNLSDGSGISDDSSEIISYSAFYTRLLAEKLSLDVSAERRQRRDIRSSPANNIFSISLTYSFLN